MSLEQRLRGYANPGKGPHGCGRDQENLDYWSDRAKENSAIAPRASDGPMKLPATRVTARDTEMKPFRSRSTDALMKEARADMDDVGTSYLPGIRRNNP